MTAKTLSSPRLNARTRARDYIAPACAALVCASAAYAGADTTFDPALTKFTDFLEGSGGKIITVMSLAGGLIALASGTECHAALPLPGHGALHRPDPQPLCDKFFKGARHAPGQVFVRMK